MFHLKNMYHFKKMCVQRSISGKVPSATLTRWNTQSSWVYTVLQSGALVLPTDVGLGA